MLLRTKILTLLLVGAFCVVIAGILFTMNQILEKQRSNEGVDGAMPKMAEVVFSEATFSVEIADTRALQERGLGGREGLCEYCGMLFPFDHPDRYGFWMKDMRFPIDILWIARGQIVFLEKSVDFHDQKRVYIPSEEADSVIELPAGSAERFNIHIGEEVVVRSAE